MSLIKEERRTLYRFLLLYLGSSFILFTVIAYLFYEKERRFFYDETRMHLQMEVSQLSSQIIHAHMSRSQFSFKSMLEKSSNKLGFYNLYNQPIVSNISGAIDFSRSLYQEQNRLILVDKSAFGHLGVQSIVIEKEGIEAFVRVLQERIVLVLFILYVVLAFIGYFLAKLFIKPIQMKRVQLDNFIKDSTHELNTPVTALMLSVNAPNLAGTKNIERIKLSAARISEIHKDLTYLLLDSDETNTEQLQALCLNSILKEELRYLSLLAEKKKITITLKEEDEIYFQIDKESFMRLIHNVIFNAIKYNHTNGEVRIIIQKNRMIIKDTGIGIFKEHQAEVYERFYRASNQVGGFGLGLNIVHKVCKMYNIQIELDSTPNQGTTFSFIF